MSSQNHHLFATSAALESSSHPRIRAVQAALRKSRRGQQQQENASPSPESAASSRSPSPADLNSVPAAASSSSSSSSSSWRPILYEVQPFDDNYTDPEYFLSTLRTNANVRPLKYTQLVLATCTLTQRICLLVLFLLLFYALYHSILTVETVLLLDTSVLLTGLIVVLCIQYALDRDRRQAKLKEWIQFSLLLLPRILLLTLLLLFLSPLLTTLTSSYSSDTIWLLTFIFSCVHLVAYDYRWINSAAANAIDDTTRNSSAFSTSVPTASSSISSSPSLPSAPNSSSIPAASTTSAAVSAPVKEFEGTLSLNAGIFASILLGSRLQQVDLTSAASTLFNTSSISSAFFSSSHLHCFSFIWYSFICFAGWSLTEYWIRRLSLKLHVGVTVMMVAICSCVLFVLSHSHVGLGAISAQLPHLLLPVFLLTCISVNLVAPAALLWSQRYKNSIHGDWDYDDSNEMESDNL